MEVDIVDAIAGFIDESRGVEVIDVARVDVEQVEHLEHEAHLRSKAKAELSIHEARRLRPDAVVLDKRASAEMTQTEPTEHTRPAIDNGAKRDDRFD